MLTGAAGGIGRETVARLLERGARVAMVDKDAAGLDALQRRHGDRVSSHRFDLHHVDRLDRLAEDVGAVDLVVHNAAFTVHGPFLAHDAADVDRVLDVDLRAAMQLTRALLAKPRPPRHFVFVSSMAGLIPFPTQSTYSAAKAGMRGFAAALRIELAREGIGVSTVFPGTIATGFLRRADTKDAEAIATLAPLMERFGTKPDRVARAIVRVVEGNRATARVGWDCHLTSVLDRVAPTLLPRLLTAAFATSWLGDHRR